MQEHLDLINQKLKAVEKILELTQAADFSDDLDVEVRMERYISLMEKREHIFAQIVKIDQDLLALPPHDEGDEVRIVNERIREAAGRIMAQDAAHGRAAEKAMTQVKDFMKKMSHGRQMHNKYMSDQPPGGSYFDKSN